MTSDKEGGGHKIMVNNDFSKQIICSDSRHSSSRKMCRFQRFPKIYKDDDFVMLTHLFIVDTFMMYDIIRIRFKLL